MPHYGVNVDDETHQHIMAGLDFDPEGGMPSRSDRIRRLLWLGAAVEHALDGAANLPFDPATDDRETVQAGVRRLIETARRVHHLDG